MFRTPCSVQRAYRGAHPRGRVSFYEYSRGRGLYLISAFRKAIILNLSAALVWAITPVLIHYVSAGFPVMFQTFARYLVSLLVLWPLFFSATSGSERARIRRRLPYLVPRMALIAVANFCFQASFTGSLYLVYPGLAMLVYQSTAVFGVLLGFVLFADERPLMREPRFHVGSLLSIVGVVMTVSVGGAGGSTAPAAGILLVLSAALSWAVLTAMVRAWLPGFSPFFVNAAVITFVTPLFLVSHLAVHGPQWAFSASGGLWVVMLLSGLMGIGLGHSLFYRSVPALGVSLSNILQLTRPFFTALFSFLIFGERLSPLQMVGGALLIAGAYVVTVLRTGEHRPALKTSAARAGH